MIFNSPTSKTSQHVLLRLPPRSGPRHSFSPFIPQSNVDLSSRISLTPTKPLPKTAHPKPTYHLHKSPRKHNTVLQLVPHPRAVDSALVRPSRRDAIGLEHVRVRRHDEEEK